jgi:hypothetical protein
MPKARSHAIPPKKSPEKSAPTYPEYDCASQRKKATRQPKPPPRIARTAGAELGCGGRAA